MPQTEHWHLDKRVPIALIVTLSLQIVGFVIWATTLSQAVDTNRRDITRLDAQVEILRTSAGAQATQLGRIEEQISGLRADIARLLLTLERGGR